MVMDFKEEQDPAPLKFQTRFPLVPTGWKLTLAQEREPQEAS